MEKEKKLVDTGVEKKVDPAQHPELTPVEQKETVSPKKAMKVSMDSALEKANNNKSGLDLFRFYRTDEVTKTNYFYYAVFVILPGTKQKFVRITLTPDIGFVSKNENYKRKGRNSNGYTLMNFAYDAGNGLKLCCRTIKKDDKSTFEFYAASSDESGIGFEVTMLASNPADIAILKCALIGYGNAHGLTYEDLEKHGEKLGEQFENFLEPGEYPEGDNSDDIF